MNLSSGQKEQFWRGGVLFYLLRSYQLEVYKAIRHRERDPAAPIIQYINCSRQTGKTFLDAVLLVEDCLRNPDIYTAFITSTKIDAKDILKKVIKPILEDCPEDLKPKWRSDDHAYVFSNGSELAVLGADDENQINRIRGRPRYKCVVDEARNIRHLRDLIESVLVPALLTTGGNIILSTTPAPSPSHESKQYYLKAKKDNALSEYTIWDAKKACPDIFTQHTLDAMADAYGGYESTSWRREFECSWEVEETLAIVPEWNHRIEKDSDGNIITRGSQCTIDIPHDAYYPYYDKYVMMDMGTVHYTWIGFGYYHFPSARLIIEHEWYGNGPKITTKLLSDIVTSQEKELNWGEMSGNIRRIADSNNPTLLNSMRSEYKVSFSPVRKNKLDTKQSILNGMVNNMRLFVQSNRVMVHPRCTFLASCLEGAVWTKNRDKFDESPELGHFDAIAGLMYGIRHLRDKHNPIPAGISINWEDPNLFIGPHDKQPAQNHSSDIDQLSKIFINNNKLRR